MPLPALKLSLKSPSKISKTSDPSRIRETRFLRNDEAATRLPQPSSSTQHSSDTRLKRRSFLPQRGELRHPAQKSERADELTSQTTIQEHPHNEDELPGLPYEVNVSPSIDVPTARVGRPRPQSMYQTSSTCAEYDNQAKAPPSTGMLRSSTASEKPTPSTSRLSRSQSVRKPAVATRSAAGPKVGAHSRNLSTSAATSIQTRPREQTSRSERPKSLFIPSSNPTRGASAVADTSTGENRTSQRIAALKHSVSDQSKPERPKSSGPTANDTDQPRSTQPTVRREPLKVESKRQARPAFSTLQQHFTPRKTGKAPTSTFLHPPAPDPAHCSLPPEITGLQTQLLQLNLLHESSVPTDKDWHRSAKERLHGKFDEVATMYQVMRDNERQALEQTNIKALREWSSGNSSFGMVEHIQLVSGPLHEVPSLLGAGGRFSKLFDEFSRWLTWVEEIWSARKDADRNLGSAEGLGVSWNLENAALMRKLTAFSRDLDRLTQPVSGSSIARIVSTCKTLVGGMLDELHTMQVIERGVVAREREWVEEELKSIAQVTGAHLDISEGNEIWRK